MEIVDGNWELVSFEERGNIGALLCYENMNTGESKEEVRHSAWDFYVEKAMSPDIHMEVDLYE